MCRRRSAPPSESGMRQNAHWGRSHSPQPSTDAPRELRQLHTTVRVPRGEKEQSLRAGAAQGAPQLRGK